MRQWEVAAVAALLVLAAAPALALPTPPPGPFTPRGPIFINGDAGFTAANGVVAGTGAPGDPYVISGWAITAASGHAIRIHNVTKEFVIRHNSLDASPGVSITSSTAVGVVQNNQFVVRGTGVHVSHSDALVIDNSFIGHLQSGAQKRGVDLVNSNSRVESNAFVYISYAVYADRGSPSIVCNDLHDDVIIAGIYVRYTTNATIECNVVTRCMTAISAINTIGTVIANNTIEHCRVGIDSRINKDVNVTNNSIRFSVETQVRLEITSGVFTNNTILDGKVDGAFVVRSPVLFANNTITAHIGAGVRFSDTSGNVTANVISRNTIGMTLEAGAVPHLTANVLVNNTVGIDLPYESRQAIVHMSANVVNGVNVDGTIDASQKVFFYQEANVTITGQVRDSGFSAGFFGSVSAQGGVVLYDVNTANINATLVAHHNVGVGIVNSFNVNVANASLVSNLVGIRAEVRVGGPQVPNCVVSVKDTNITIPVDPIATFGVDVRGCLAIVGRVNISIVDTGVRVDAGGSLILFNSTITETRVAVDVAGQPNGVNLTGNLVVNNFAGVRFRGTTGIVHDNTFLDNDLYGVRLEFAAALSLERNNFTANGIGLLDANACLGAGTCSRISASGNSFIENRGDGARVNGSSTWQGDVALGNGGSGLVLASNAQLDGVLAAGNGDDGARLVGTFRVEGSIFHANGNDGLEIVGSGVLRDSNFTFNEEAGIRATTNFVDARGLNVSSNFDGIVTAQGGAAPPLVPTLPGLVSFAAAAVSTGPSPFHVHRSTFLANERDAVRAGASLVNATHNYWGDADGPSVSIADQVGAFQNGVSPAVRFAPYYTDPTMTTTGPVAGL